MPKRDVHEVANTKHREDDTVANGRVGSKSGRDILSWLSSQSSQPLSWRINQLLFSTLTFPLEEIIKRLIRIMVASSIVQFNFPCWNGRDKNRFKLKERSFKPILNQFKSIFIHFLSIKIQSIPTRILHVEHVLYVLYVAAIWNTVQKYKIH